MKPPNSYILVILIVVLAAILRITFAQGIPLSGDEVISVIQATGQAVTYQNRHWPDNVPLSELKNFISYSEDHSVRNLFVSLRDAGMHPPFYYIVLRYFLKYIGNDAFYLRLFSIILSLFSIVCIYLLGKTVCNDRVGVLSALILAISSYGIKYGAMVRPYPLAMLLSIVATTLVYQLCKDEKFAFINLKTIIYMLTILIGLYTIYHFVFVVILHLVMVVAHNIRNKKVLFRVVFLYGFVTVCYLPWLPFLLSQMKIIKAGSFYFHKKSGSPLFLSLFHSTVYTNFLQSVGGESLSLLRLLITAMIGGATFLGCIDLARDKKGRIFVGAIMAYLLSWFLADLALGVRTLRVAKLHFFLVPIGVALLATGIFLAPERFHIKRSFMFVVCGILLLNSIGICYAQTNYDGPGGMEMFQEKISRYVSRENQKQGLVLVNTARRRFLLPFAHVVNEPVDVYLVRMNELRAGKFKLYDCEKYCYVFIADIRVPTPNETFLTENKLDIVKNHLLKCGFVFIDSAVTHIKYRPAKGVILVFRKETSGCSDIIEGRRLFEPLISEHFS